MPFRLVLANQLAPALSSLAAAMRTVSSNIHWLIISRRKSIAVFRLQIADDDDDVTASLLRAA